MNEILEYFKAEEEVFRAPTLSCSSSNSLEAILADIDAMCADEVRGTPEATLSMKTAYVGRCSNLLLYIRHLDGCIEEDFAVLNDFDPENRLLEKIEGIFVVSLKELLFNERFSLTTQICWRQCFVHICLIYVLHMLTHAVTKFSTFTHAHTASTKTEKTVMHSSSSGVFVI